MGLFGFVLPLHGFSTSANISYYKLFSHLYIYIYMVICYMYIYIYTQVRRERERERETDRELSPDPIQTVNAVADSKGRVLP